MKKPVAVASALFLFSLTQSLTSYAAPAAPSPSCGIKARVIKIEHQTRNGPKEDQELYLITLDVLEIKTERPEPPLSCDELYPLGSKPVTMQSPKCYLDNKFKEGAIIRGIIEWGGDEYSHGISLWDVKVVNEPDKQ